MIVGCSSSNILFKRCLFLTSFQVGSNNSLVCSFSCKSIYMLSMTLREILANLKDKVNSSNLFDIMKVPSGTVCNSCDGFHVIFIRVRINIVTLRHLSTCSIQIDQAKCRSKRRSNHARQYKTKVSITQASSSPRTAKSRQDRLTVESSAQKSKSKGRLESCRANRNDFCTYTKESGKHTRALVLKISLITTIIRNRMTTNDTRYPSIYTLKS